ncbi:holin [Streptomyces marianii]|nr:holin [Streptomyces marianii]
MRILEGHRRAVIRTFAQGTLGVASADALGILDVDWGGADSPWFSRC